MPRVRVFEDQGELTIEIGPYSGGYVKVRLLMAAIVFGALAIQSVRALRPLIHSGHAVLGVAYVAIFAFMSLVGLSRFIWFTYGNEEIVLRGGLLGVSRRLGILKTAQVYRLNEVKDIHTALRVGSAFSLLPRGRVGFRHKNRMRYMADRIDTQEAKRLVRIFRDWLPRDSWTPVLGL
jgi:hypothetical protein